MMFKLLSILLLWLSCEANGQVPIGYSGQRFDPSAFGVGRPNTPLGIPPPLGPNLRPGVGPNFVPGVGPNLIPGVNPNLVPGVRPNLGPGDPRGFNPYYNAPGVAVPILQYSNDQNIDGSYQFSYSTADGKQAQETGYLKNLFVNNQGEPEGIQVKEGSYSYTAPDGSLIQVNYIADENGFRVLPSNGRLPLPPSAALNGIPLAPGAAPNALNSFDPRLNYNRGYNTIPPINPGGRRF